MSVQDAPLKAVFFMHFILSVWAIQAGWLPISYLYYNLIFLIVLLWAIKDRESSEPVFMAIIIDAISIILDCISVGVYYSNAHANAGMDEFRFSAGMSILNILLRPLSIFLLLKIFNERTGRYSDFGFPGISSPFGRGPYEDIDSSPPQSVPKSPMDTGSPSHQLGNDSHIPPPYSSQP